MEGSELSPLEEQVLTRKELLAAAGIVAGSAAVVGGFSASSAAAMINRGAVNRASRTFKLGATLPLTGFAAADGLAEKRGQVMAVEEWNARGGVLGHKIELVQLDLGTMEPAHHQSLVRQLTEKYKVDAVVTGYTYYPGVELDLFARSGIPYLSVNTNEDDATIVRKNLKKYWNIYQYDPTNKWYGLGFPTFVKQIVDTKQFKPASKKIAIVYASDNYDTTIAKNCKGAMEKYGWKVSLYEKVTSPVNEWGPVLAKVKKDPPDIVFLASGVLGDAVAFAKQFTQDPTKSIIYGQFVLQLKEYRDQVGKDSEGGIWSTVLGLLSSTKEAKAFVAAFKKRWKAEPSAGAEGYMYDGTNLYLASCRAAGTIDDHRKILHTMTRLHYRGVCGTYSFNPADQVAWNYPDQVKSPTGGIPHLYLQIQNGKNEIIAPAPYTTSKFKLPSYF